MAILDPGTRSPGKVALFYIHGAANVVHHSSLNYINGVDMDNISQIRTDANNLLAFCKAVCTTSTTFTGWGALSPTGQILYREEFGARPPGTHAISGGMKDYYGITLTIPGRGAPITTSSGSGQTRFRLWTGGAYGIEPGDKILRVANQDASWANLVAHLSGNLRYFADFYGQHADPNGTYPVQWNAHTQRRNGS